MGWLFTTSTDAIVEVPTTAYGIVHASAMVATLQTTTTLAVVRDASWAMVSTSSSRTSVIGAASSSTSASAIFSMEVVARA